MNKMINHDQGPAPLHLLDNGRSDSYHDYSIFLRSSLQLAVVVILLFVCIFAFLERSFLLDQKHVYLLGILLGLVLFFQRYHNCFRPAAFPALSELILRKSLAWAFTFLFVTLIVTLTELRNIPRSLLFSVVLTSYAVDLLFAVANYTICDKAKEHRALPEDEEETRRYELCYTKVGTGFALLMGSSIAVMMIKSMSLHLYTHYEQLFVVIITSWIIALGLTRAYVKEQSRNIYYRIAPVVKLGIMMTLLAGAFYWYGQLEYISRGVLFGSIVTFTTLQLIIVLLSKQSPSTGGRCPYLHGSATDSGVAAGPAAENPERPSRFQFDSYLPRQVVVDSRFELKRMLENMLPAVDRKDVSILFSAEEECIQSAGRNRLILINLQGLNFIEHLNQYMRTIRGQVAEGGYFVTWVYPLDTTYSRLRSSMPKSLFVFVYPLHFALFRVVPKLPILSNIYFYFTKGRHANISKVEVFGRLVYNGFSVVGSKEINHKLYVIARADRPLLNVEPSYGLIAKLHRIGYQGRRITIYKFRTMHPYSEFIQEDIYKWNREIDERSKFVNDYRITAWGSILRRYWLDELPQLYNWLKGDIGWVGVRALSDHKFSLYPPDMQRLRIQYKPGLIPPLYADLPKNFDEILSSERRYLEEWGKRPIATDIKYFCRALYNILVNGARSS